MIDRRSVLFTGWKDHLEMIPLIHLLKKYGLGLADAKHMADKILERKQVEFCLSNADDTKLLVKEAKKLGVICELIND